MKKSFFVLAILVATSVFAQNRTISAERSKVNFVITNAGLEVEGFFSKINGYIQLDPHHLQASKIKAIVDVSSLNTGIEMRDKHLKDKDYFDVSKYPQMKFESESFSKTSSGYSVAGHLTIKDVTKQITIPFSASDDSPMVLKGHLKIDRRDYHVGGNSWIMGDEVSIDLEIAAF